MSQCDYIKDDGEQCGAQAVTGRDYCRHHPPDSEQLRGAKDTAPSQGKAVGQSYDEKAITELTALLDDARSGSTKVQAAEVLLRHARESDG